MPQSIMTPDGPVDFPDDWSDEQIEAELKRFYAPEGEKESRDNEHGLRPAGETDMDIAHGVLQGARNFGEGILSAPKQIDDFERAAIQFLKNWRPAPDSSNYWNERGADVLNKIGDVWEQTTPLPDESILLDDGEGHRMAAPTPEQADQIFSQQLGPDFQPQTGAGQFAEEALPYALGFGYLAPGKGSKALHLLKKYGPWAGGAVGAGGLFQGGGDLYGALKEFVVGPKLKPNPGLNALPPIR